MSSFGENLFKGTATLGHFYSKIGLGIGSIISILLLIGGIYLLTTNQNNLIDTSAKIKSSNCTKNNITKNNKEIIYNCDLDVLYIVEGKEYNNRINLNTENNNNTGDIMITYDKNDPNKVTRQIFRNKYTGIIMIIFSVIIFGGSYLNYYITGNYEIAAAAQGVSTIITTIK